MSPSGGLSPLLLGQPVSTWTAAMVSRCCGSQRCSTIVGLPQLMTLSRPACSSVAAEARRRGSPGGVMITALAWGRSRSRSRRLNSGALRRLSSHSRSRADAVTHCSLKSGIVGSMVWDEQVDRLLTKMATIDHTRNGPAEEDNHNQTSLPTDRSTAGGTIGAAARLGAAVRQQTQQWRFTTRRAAATGGEPMSSVACSSGCARALAPARLPAAAGPATGRVLQQMCHRWHHRV